MSSAPSPQRHVEHHHYAEPTHKRHRCQVDVAGLLRFGDQFLDDDIDHRAGREAERVRQQRRRVHDVETHSHLLKGITMLAGIVTGSVTIAEDKEPADGAIGQFGKMHEAIGQQKHEGRVRFQDVVKRPHFFGVAALEGLYGEATILDGKVTITRVDANGRMQPVENGALESQATLLVGAYVPEWMEHAVTDDVVAEKFDAFIAETATKAGISIESPFLFTVQGEFHSVRQHVINGACPIHARLKKVELPREQRPFESEIDEVCGTVVGVFANDAVGNLTHPATSTHVPLLFKDPVSGKLVTGHLEQVGLRKGDVLSLPR